MPFYQKEREVNFSSFGVKLAKCCFCNGSKIEKEFEEKEM